MIMFFKLLITVGSFQENSRPFVDDKIPFIMRNAFKVPPKKHNMKNESYLEHENKFKIEDDQNNEDFPKIETNLKKNMSP